MDLPALVSTDLRLNEPRWIRLPELMKAKRKPLEKLPFASFGVEARSRVKLVKYEPPAQRQKGVMVGSAAELVSALRGKRAI